MLLTKNQNIDKKVRKILTRIKVLRVVVVVVHLSWSQVNTTVQRLAADKGEILRQHADEVDQYERRIRSLTEEVCWFHFNAWQEDVYWIPLHCTCYISAKIQYIWLLTNLSKHTLTQSCRQGQKPCVVTFQHSIIKTIDPSNLISKN